MLDLFVGDERQCVWARTCLCMCVRIGGLQRARHGALRGAKRALHVPRSHVNPVVAFPLTYEKLRAHGCCLSACHQPPLLIGFPALGSVLLLIVIRPPPPERAPWAYLAALSVGPDAPPAKSPPAAATPAPAPALYPVPAPDPEPEAAPDASSASASYVTRARSETAPPPARPPLPEDAPPRPRRGRIAPPGFRTAST